MSGKSLGKTLSPGETNANYSSGEKSNDFWFTVPVAIEDKQYRFLMGEA
jgi:hypothetical protein